MDTIQCAIVLAKLERFEWELAQRQRIADRYRSRLGEACAWRGIAHLNYGPLQLLPPPAQDRTCVYAQFTLIARDRDGIREHLDRAGIPTAVHYPTPLNRQPAFAAYCCPDCTPIASLLSEHVLSLPFGPDLTEEDQDRVCEAVLAAAR